MCVRRLFYSHFFFFFLLWQCKNIYCYNLFVSCQQFYDRIHVAIWWWTLWRKATYHFYHMMRNTQKWTVMQFAGQHRPWSACAFVQADQGLRCPLTEPIVIAVYVDEQKMPASDCTDAHADLDLDRGFFHMMPIICKQQISRPACIFAQFNEGLLFFSLCGSVSKCILQYVFTLRVLGENFSG